jgi:hypothetical protein
MIKGGRTVLMEPEAAKASRPHPNREEVAARPTVAPLVVEVIAWEARRLPDGAIRLAGIDTPPPRQGGVPPHGRYPPAQRGCWSLHHQSGGAFLLPRE